MSPQTAIDTSAIAKIIKNLARWLLLAVFLLPVFLVIAYFGFAKYKSYPVDSFCDDVSDRDTPEDVLSRANSRGLFPVQWEGTDNIWVFNQEGPPMFRFACSVEFKGGKVLKKEVVDAD